MFDRFKTKLRSRAGRESKQDGSRSNELEGKKGVSATPVQGNSTASDVLKPLANEKSATTPAELQSPAPLSRDLWALALQKLDQTTQDRLKTMGLEKLQCSSTESDIEGLVSLVNMKQKECEHKFWRIKVGDHDVLLRNLTVRILGWLEKTGDIAVQLSPFQASPVWAVIKAVMQIPVVEAEQMAALLGLTEQVVRIVTRGQVYEDVFLDKDVEQNGDKLLESLRDSLVRIYVTSLELLADAERLFSQNTARQTLEAIINPGKVSGGLSSLATQEDELLRDVEACNTRLAAARGNRIIGMLACLNAPLVRVDENVQKLLEKTSQTERLELLEKISPVKFGAHHDNVRHARTPGTCEWLLHDASFSRWKEANRSELFWLQGSPGTGKTYLTSRVVDLVKDDLEELPRNEVLAFYYCDRNQKDRGDALSIFRSYVRQLSTSAMYPDSMQLKLKELCRRAEESGTDLSFETCQEQILASLEIYTQVTLVLDALDECDRNSQYQLIEAFSFLVRESKNTLKVYIASRPSPETEAQLQKVEEYVTSITIQASHNALDIRKFLEQELDKLAKQAPFMMRIKDRVAERLLEHSQGMFQWAFLQVNQITRCRTESSVWKRLDNLPQGLQKAYNEIWKGIEDLEDPDRTFVKRALKWVMVANWPLEVPYLLSAIRLDVDDNDFKSEDILNKDDLLYLCGNLLVLDSDDVWRFSHLSVIEYLETAHQWSTQKAHSYAAITCLSLLINTYGSEYSSSKEGDSDRLVEGESFDPRSIKSRFNIYARHNWVFHVHGARPTETSSVGTYLKLFLGTPEETSIQYRRWLALIESDSNFIHLVPNKGKSRFEISGFDLAVFTERARSGPPYWRFAIEIWATELTPSDKPIFAMCRFDFDSILSEWWDHPSIDVYQKNDMGHNPLTIAAIAGSVSICKRLIEKGTDVNLTLDNSIFGSALVAAAYWGHTDVLRCLVEAGADPNIHLNSAEGREDGSQNDNQGDLSPGSTKSASHGWFSSPLVVAVEKNQVEATKYLVNEAKADIHKQLTYCGQGTVLEIAASAGNHEIIKCLIEAGSDINKPPLDPTQGTIAERAFPHGDLKTIRFLVEEAGADVHGLTPESQLSIIEEAVANKRLDGVKYLVEECHFDVNQTSRKDSPLIAAVRNQDMDFVHYLLGKGADVNRTSRDGRSSPLKTAASIGSIDIVKCLINHGAEINSPLDQHHGSPLVEALRNFHIDCASCLIENGADVNIISVGERGSPLVAAAATGNIDLVAMLLERGADINVIAETDPRYGSVLVAATWASTNSVEMITFLLQAGAASHLNTPLMHRPGGSVLAASVARIYVSPEPIRCLLEAGAVVDLPLEHGDFGSALSAAACHRGNEEIIKLFIQAGANPNLQLTLGLYGSALAAASTSRRTGCAKALLEGGADPNMQLQIGPYRSALAWAAASHGSEEVIQLLIDSGADVNMPLSGEYPSAFAVAIAKERHANIEVLVEAGAHTSESLADDIAS